jgi:hypothetical protein
MKWCNRSEQFDAPRPLYDGRLFVRLKLPNECSEMRWDGTRDGVVLKTFWSGRSVAAWIGLVPIAFWVSVVQSTWPHGPINLHTRYYLSFFIDDV